MLEHVPESAVARAFQCLKPFKYAGAAGGADWNDGIAFYTHDTCLTPHRAIARYGLTVNTRVATIPRAVGSSRASRALALPLLGLGTKIITNYSQARSKLY